MDGSSRQNFCALDRGPGRPFPGRLLGNELLTIYAAETLRETRTAEILSVTGILHALAEDKNERREVREAAAETIRKMRS